MLQCFIVGQAPWPLTQTADPTETSRTEIYWYTVVHVTIYKKKNKNQNNTISADKNIQGLAHGFKLHQRIITCACAAYYAVVNDGAAVDCNLQAVVCVVVLGGFIIRIELQWIQKMLATTVIY